MPHVIGKMSPGAFVMTTSARTMGSIAVLGVSVASNLCRSGATAVPCWCVIIRVNWNVVVAQGDWLYILP